MPAAARLTLALSAIALSLTGCATAPATAPPKGCDGHHRRPANPYGSVLDGSQVSRPPGPVPSAPAAPAAGPACGDGAPGGPRGAPKPEAEAAQRA